MVEQMAWLAGSFVSVESIVYNNTSAIKKKIMKQDNQRMMVYLMLLIIHNPRSLKVGVAPEFMVSHSESV